MQLITFMGSIFVFCLSALHQRCSLFAFNSASCQIRFERKIHIHGGGSPTFPFSGAAQNFCICFDGGARWAAEKFSKLPHPKYLSNHSCDCWPKKTPNALYLLTWAAVAGKSRTPTDGERDAHTQTQINPAECKQFEKFWNQLVHGS